jgi:hypothetical protein
MIFTPIRLIMKIKEPTKNEKDKFISSMKMKHLGPSNGGLYGIIKGFKLVKRTRIHYGRFALNILISAIPIVFGILFPSFFWYSVLLTVVAFIVAGFVINPFTTTEIDYNDLGS